MLPLGTTKHSQTFLWAQYVTFPVHKISRGMSYAIDFILGDENALRFNAKGATSHSSLREELDDGSLYSNTPINILNQVDEDDAAKLAKGLAATSLNHRLLDNTDNIISIGAIVSSCQQLQILGMSTIECSARSLGPTKLLQRTMLVQPGVGQ